MKKPRVEHNIAIPDNSRKIAGILGIDSRQKKQNAKIEEAYETFANVQVEVIQRDENGESGGDLREKMGELDKNKLIFLDAGIVHKRDAIIRLIESLLDKTVQNLCQHIEIIRRNEFSDEKVTVIIVRNANMSDVHTAVELGGKNTVLAVYGHGVRTAVNMTDGRVANDNIDTPEEKLKALWQLTCLEDSMVNNDSEKLGERISNKKQTYLNLYQ